MSAAIVDTYHKGARRCGNPRSSRAGYIAIVRPPAPVVGKEELWNAVSHLVERGDEFRVATRADIRAGAEMRRMRCMKALAISANTAPAPLARGGSIYLEPERYGFSVVLSRHPIENVRLHTGMRANMLCYKRGEHVEYVFRDDFCSGEITLELESVFVATLYLVRRNTGGGG